MADSKPKRKQQSTINAVALLLSAFLSMGMLGVERFTLEMDDSHSGICWIRMSTDSGLTWDAWQDLSDNICFELSGCLEGIWVVCIGNRSGVKHITVEVTNVSSGVCGIGLYSDQLGNKDKWGTIGRQICFEFGDCAWNISYTCIDRGGE